MPVLLVVEKGGAAGQQVSVSVVHTETLLSEEVLSERQTAECTTGMQCMDGYVACQGPASCGALVPYLVGSVAPQDAAAGAMVAGSVEGQGCTHNYTCQSGSCCDGACC